MGSPFASSKKAIAYCDVCGWQYKLKELRSLIVKGRDTNIKACPECWNGAMELLNEIKNDLSGEE